MRGCVQGGVVVVVVVVLLGVHVAGVQVAKLDRLVLFFLLGHAATWFLIGEKR